MDLKVVPRWHALTYFYTLSGCFGNVPHINVDDMDPYYVDMEPEGNVP
jgi:hypothetical protein